MLTTIVYAVVVVLCDIAMYALGTRAGEQQALKRVFETSKTERVVLTCGDKNLYVVTENEFCVLTDALK